LDIIWNLVIGIWDFNTVSGKENRFFPDHLELTLTLHWCGVLLRCFQDKALIWSEKEETDNPAIRR
jgi:hypothetical protein